VSEAKRKPLYQPWNEEAFRADLQVGAMSPTQRWIYRTLLQAAFFHSTRPYLPDDDTQLWLLAGCESPKQWDRNKGVVRAMFTPVEVDGIRLLSQKRLLADWNRIEEKRQMLSENGRRGRKAQLELSDSQTNAGRLPGNCPTNAGEEKLKEGKGSKEKKNTSAPNTDAASVELPDWLPKEPWNNFLAMRKKLRKPMTAEAVRLAIKRLEELRAAGNDPKAVLEQSILNSYQGIFEVRAVKGGASGNTRPSGAIHSDRQCNGPADYDIREL